VPKQYTKADWPTEGDVQEGKDGYRWCAVCRSCWCPHCEPWLYADDSDEEEEAAA
jgi:hypothetical protein